MTKKQKRIFVRILIGAGLFLAAAALPFISLLSQNAAATVQLLLYIAAYLVIGGDVLYGAVRNILRGRVFDENFLMGIATVGAFCLREYPEAVGVMLFYQIGELFQSYAVAKSRKSISDLMDIRPEFANVERDGDVVEVDPENVAVDEIIVVKPGERIPLDGVVIDGSSQLDTAALTGESVPRNAKIDDTVISGCINLSGVLRIRVGKPYGESTVARILDLVENASNKKAKAENFITRFAQYYTPIVVVCAALLAVLPPLLFGGVWADWIQRALIFLMISCPCALVISVPLSFFGGIGGASKAGVLVKGSNYLEALSKVDTVVFDKTGTLTHGTFTVTAVHPQTIDEARLLEFAAFAESYSSHPISLSLQQAYGKDIDSSRVGNVQEIAGHGVSATVDGHTVLCGNDKHMSQNDIPCHTCHLVGTIVHVAVDGDYAGHIVISDTVKEGAKEAIAALKALGVKRTVMLTGDREAVGKATAETLGVDEYHAELLPADKVAEVERLLSEEDRGGRLAFVGDGINDAPVLTRADVGIAMGALGSDAAIEAADVVLMDDRPEKIATAMRIARKTLAIVRQNIIFALAVKFLVLGLGAFGVATIWEAVVADVGVSVIAILNAMRALKIK